MSQPILICLGRYGDILNALRLAKHINDTLGKPKFIVSKDFWPILNGIRYVNPVVWDMKYSELPRAIAEARRIGKVEPIVCQAYTHPDSRHLTDSYQREAWRLAGYLDKFAECVLDVDDVSPRSPRLTPDSVLVAGSGVSSPFDMEPIVEHLKSHGLNVVSTSSLGVLPSPLDLLGAIRSCGCLLTIDTMHLHLAWAAPETPVVALVNDGWLGSVPPSNAVATFRYSAVDKDMVLASVTKALATHA